MSCKGRLVYSPGYQETDPADDYDLLILIYQFHHKKSVYYFLAEILLIARSVMAVIVKDGFTPGLAEIAEPSQT